MTNQPTDLLDLFVVPLARAGIAHLVSGSVASMFYGEPRATLDVDVAIQLPAGRIPLLESCFPSDAFYLPPAEVLHIELSRPTHGHFNVIHLDSGYKADFYPSRDHPYLSWAVSRAVPLDLGEVTIRLAPPEYVILWKLEFLRLSREDKHVRDIRGILQVSADRIDLPFLKQAIRETGLQEPWELVTGGEFPPSMAE